jgi:hypothetical protein
MNFTDSRKSPKSRMAAAENQEKTQSKNQCCLIVGQRYYFDEDRDEYGIYEGYEAGYHWFCPEAVSLYILAVRPSTGRLRVNFRTSNGFILHEPLTNEQIKTSRNAAR